MSDERIEMQARDDVFRDKLLGPTCFCGASGGVVYGAMGDGGKITITRQCAPLACLAHGYCAAHLTPVSAQMSTDDKARLAVRCGFDLNKVL